MKDKEIWDYIEPKRGDQIRVKRINYYHHGIYISHDEVIQFGYGDERDAGHSERISVNRVTLSEFLKGGFLEIRVYSKKELKRKNDIEEIVNNARKQLGTKGYDILDNNCEHFSNLCVFNEKISVQTEAFTQEVLQKMKK